MSRQVRHLAVALFLVLVAGSCGKSATAPKPPAELPNDPSATPPAFSYVNHFQADTQWVEISPTSDDVEIGSIKLYFQVDPGSAWVQMYTRTTGGPIVQRGAQVLIAVDGPKFGHAPNAATLHLSTRRKPYRTWFNVVPY